MRRAAILAVVALVLVGCTDDDKPDAATESSASSGPPPSAVNLCNELTLAGIKAATGIDFPAGTYDGTKCVWTSDDGARLAMAVLEDPLLTGFFVVVENAGGQPVTVPDAVRATASSQPEGADSRVLLAVETHIAIGIGVTLIAPSATIDQAVSLAKQAFAAAGY